MHISRAIILGLAGLSRLVVATEDQNATDTLIDLNSQAIDALQDAADDAQTTKRANGCSLFNASVRRDWLVSQSPPVDLSESSFSIADLSLSAGSICHPMRRRIILMLFSA
jgi:hypothetical protein